VMALDGGRFGWSSVPVWLQAVGAGLIAASMLLCAWVFRENSFAAPVVSVQDGQRVISTGPYAIVRHPMYAGAIPLFIGAPLLLSSWWGLVLSPVYLIGVGWRARLEERTLIDALPAYDAYAARVRYRLVPLVW
jgi:protein-S-isoprenylcysteine O-methyltransferase Ste14